MEFYDKYLHVVQCLPLGVVIIVINDGCKQTY